MNWILLGVFFASFFPRISMTNRFGESVRMGGTIRSNWKMSRRKSGREFCTGMPKLALCNKQWFYLHSVATIKILIIFKDSGDFQRLLSNCSRISDNCCSFAKSFSREYPVYNFRIIPQQNRPLELRRTALAVIADCHLISFFLSGKALERFVIE